MKDKNRKKKSYLSHEMVFWCSTVNSEPIITDQQYRPLYRVALKFEISLLGPSHRAQYHAANDFADTRSALMDQPCSSCAVPFQEHTISRSIKEISAMHQKDATGTQRPICCCRRP